MATYAKHEAQDWAWETLKDFASAGVAEPTTAARTPATMRTRLRSSPQEHSWRRLRLRSRPAD